MLFARGDFNDCGFSATVRFLNVINSCIQRKCYKYRYRVYISYECGSTRYQGNSRVARTANAENDPDASSSLRSNRRRYWRRYPGCREDGIPAAYRYFQGARCSGDVTQSDRGPTSARGDGGQCRQSCDCCSVCCSRIEYDGQGGDGQFSEPVACQ